MAACAVVAVSSSCNVTPEWHGVHRSSSKTENVWHPPSFFSSCFHVFVLHQDGLVASTFMCTVCFMFSYFTGLHQKSISLNTFPLALASRFQIAVPWKRRCQYFQLMYLFKGQMKFLSQTESPIVRYVQQNLLPQVLFSHKCCHTTFKNVFIVTIEKREKR